MLTDWRAKVTLEMLLPSLSALQPKKEEIQRNWTQPSALGSNKLELSPA